MTYIMKFIVDTMKANTRTTSNVYLAKLINISQFINSAIIPFILKLLIEQGNSYGNLFG